MINCGWCRTPTKPIYPLNDGKYLCPICAEKHFNLVYTKMTKHIEEINNGLKKKRRRLVKLKQDMCLHTKAYSTGYSKFFSPKVMKEIWDCPDCNKRFYK